jgi:hypothetical protein
MGPSARNCTRSPVTATVKGVGTDTLSYGGNFEEDWSGATYQSGTATLDQDYLAEWFYCSNNGLINGACWNTYTIQPTDDYSDGTTSGGWYAISTQDYWQPYIVGSMAQQAEGYTVPDKNFNYDTIRGCYVVGVNSNYWYGEECLTW